MQFVSCSDGLGLSTRRTATKFTLTVNPAPDYQVAIVPPMIKDGGCSELIELLSPAETYAKVTGFDWSQATRVPATDSQGRPTLYYAWIYIKNEKELLALRQLYIHVLKRPIFQNEIDALDDRCGTLTNPGDGTGAFVSALIPGATYNKLIDAFTTSEIEGEREVFDAVILRTIPPEMRTAQNSVDLTKLADSGFRYLGYEADPFRAPNEIIADAGVIKLFVDAVAWIAAATQDFASGLGQLINELGKALRGSSNLTLHVHLLNRDPQFGTGQAMVRGWGRHYGQPLGASGMQVTVLQNSLALPSESIGHTDATGRAVVNVAKRGGVRGSGICLEFTTPAAMITDFLTDSSSCDFRQWDPVAGSIAAHNLTLEAVSLGVDRTVRALIDHGRLNTLYQADDVFQYSKEVVGFAPKRARILAGSAGGFFTLFTQGAPFTPCLNYGNSFQDAATLAAAMAGAQVGSLLGPLSGAVGVAVTGFIASVTFNSDIVLPEGLWSDQSRVAATHEYGHYLFCSLMMERNNASVDHVVWSTMFSGNSWEKPIRYINEAFADFIAGQVAGGANYPWPALVDSAGAPLVWGFTNGRIFDAGTYSCRASFAEEPGGIPWCFDSNLRGTRSPLDQAQAGTEHIGRFATLLHDAFDGNSVSSRGFSVPGDADIWTHSSHLIRPKQKLDATGNLMFDATGNPVFEPELDTAGNPRFDVTGNPIFVTEELNGPLVASSIGYANTDSRLERVALSGEALLSLAGRIADGLQPIANMAAWGDGETIDDRKFLKALDETMAEHHYSWCDRCRVFALHNPNPNLPANVTDIRQMFESCMGSDMVGSAPTFADRIEADTCQPCQPGYRSNERGVCELQPCQADVIVQGPSLARGVHSFDTTATTPGDVCSNLFVLRVEDFQGLPIGLSESTIVSVQPAALNQGTCERAFPLERSVWLGGAESELKFDTIGQWFGCSDALCANACRNMLFVPTQRSEADTVEYRSPSAAGFSLIFEVPTVFE